LDSACLSGARLTDRSLSANTPRVDGGWLERRMEGLLDSTEVSGSGGGGLLALKDPTPLRISLTRRRSLSSSSSSSYSEESAYASPNSEPELKDMEPGPFEVFVLPREETDADGCTWALGARAGGELERLLYGSGESGDSGNGAIPGELEDPVEVDNGGGVVS
jgi:hypothetical protein